MEKGIGQSCNSQHLCTMFRVSVKHHA